MKRTGEAAFETVIEAHLLANGYVSVPGGAFDRERAIFPDAALDFIRRTQPAEWGRLEALLGPQTGAQIVADLCSWMDTHGALATLRHGFKCYGRTLYAAFFKAAHDLNPELNARYAANRTGITRQLRFSPHSQQSLDVTLSVNVERMVEEGRQEGELKGRREGELRGRLQAAQGLLGRDVPWSTIEAATGIDEAAFRRLKQQLDDNGAAE